MVLCVLFFDTTLKVDTYLWKRMTKDTISVQISIFKVSFDSQLNYVLCSDKASKHNNHGIRLKLCKLKHYLHLVMIWIISLFSLLYLLFIRLIVVLLFLKHRVASKQLQTKHTLPMTSKLIAEFIVSLLQCLPSNVVQPWFINVQIVMNARIIQMVILINQRPTTDQQKHFACFYWFFDFWGVLSLIWFCDRSIEYLRREDSLRRKI